MKYITARRLNLFFTGLKNGAIKTKEESMACTDPKRLVGNGVVKELNNSLNGGNCVFDYVQNDGLYYSVKVGADTVRKKCSVVSAYKELMSIWHEDVWKTYTYTAEKNITILINADTDCLENGSCEITKTITGEVKFIYDYLYTWKYSSHNKNLCAICEMKKGSSINITLGAFRAGICTLRICELL
ncbi:MAG: hypothetical protein RRY99_09535 [Flavobacterium sp.]